MKTFYGVTIFAFVAGMAILSCFAPWTATPAENAVAHDSLGYAAVWSPRFAGVAGARVDWGAFGILAGGVAFFAIGLGAIAYFFRNKRGAERTI